MSTSDTNPNDPYGNYRGPPYGYGTYQGPPIPPIQPTQQRVSKKNVWFTSAVVIALLGLFGTICTVCGNTMIASINVSSTPKDSGASSPPVAQIPILHNTYSGHLDMDGYSARFIIASVSENNTTGSFTATGNDGCPTQITNGTVSADGTIKFTMTEATVLGTACEGGSGDFIGNVQPNGSMSGSWSISNQPQGSWDLS